jgi:hypothetical protein
MSTLTKEQIEKLTPEQQKDLAALELRRLEKRERLLKQARQSQIRVFMQGVGFAAVLGVAVYMKFPSALLFSIGGLAAITLSEIVFANRRIDALLELYENDRGRHDAA